MTDGSTKIAANMLTSSLDLGSPPGFRSFKVYALSSVVSANLLTLARHAIG